MSQQGCNKKSEAQTPVGLESTPMLRYVRMLVITGANPVMPNANEIVKNSVVTLNYTVTDPDGAVIDDGNQPLVYLHGGYDGLFLRLEEALHGKAIGDTLKIKLQPPDAFGDYDEGLVAVEDADLFPENIAVGMAFERVSDDGEVIYRITDIADGKVVVDGNHPLAGVALIFDMTVTEVRPATDEEIAHGHVHGDDDDHHHDHGGHSIH
jgi:FKBP-type peptidyl-prolyl cis-trans isomerase SlyD